MPEPVQVDVLASPEPPRASRRAVLTGVAAAALVLGTAATADGLRLREERAEVAACATGALAAVRDADAAIAGIAGYVRPSVVSVPSGTVRDGLFAMVEEAAVEARGPVGSALDACRGLTVLPWHASEAERRDGCVRLLALTRARVDAVAGDGRRAFRLGPDRDRARASCARAR